MVSSPRRYRSSASTENTGSRSWSSRGRRAASQSALSPAAPALIASQMSAIAEVVNGLEGPVDILVRVGKGQEHRFELRRREVDAPVEQMAEERPVALGVRVLRVVVVPNLAGAHEEREHRPDSLDASEQAQPLFQSGA